MNDDLDKTVEDAASKLAEHCDSVRIFVTSHGDGSSSDTKAYSTGRGNFYAQNGQIKEWIIRQDEYACENARNEQNEDGEEE